MARARLQGDFLAVSQRFEDQDPRGDSLTNSKSTGAIDSTPYVAGVTSCLLERETQPPKYICMAYSADLYRAWGHLQEAIDRLQVQGRKGGGTHASTKGVLSKDNKNNNVGTCY